MACLSANQLCEFVEGVLPESERTEVEEELASCAECRALLCDWAQTTLRSIPEASGPNDEQEDDDPSTPRQVHRRGDRWGGYELSEYLGAGGMGMVFSARDLELDRDIAIKVVHPDLDGGSEQLLAEARAMAAVQHPNVIAVYAAGRADDLAFIAMEKLDEATLAHWLATERTTPEILDAFVGVARGLAALHEHGFVHRDVKPSNVLIDELGVAKLGDFGLASRNGRAERVGTPAFMAPEVRAGAKATHQSDQYSFCTTLEACWPNAPATVARVIKRGLAEEPSSRFESMTALAEALELALRTSPKRSLAIGLAVGVSVAMIAVLLLSRGSSEPDCGDGTDPVLWSTELQEVVRTQFRASERPWALVSFSRIDKRLAELSTSWRATRHESCKRRDHAKERCLDRVAKSLESTMSMLANANAKMVDAAADIANALPDPSTCGSDGTETDVGNPLAATIARGQVLVAAGKWAEAVETLGSIEAETLAVGEHRLIARHQLALASARRRQQRYDDAAKALTRAATAAAAVADSKLLATIYRDHAIVVGYYQDEVKAGRAHLETAASWAKQANEQGVFAKIEDARGLISITEGKFTEAAKAFTRSLEIRTKAGDELGRAESHYLRGIASRHHGELDKARADFDQAIKIRQLELGENHPDIFRVYNEIGIVVGRQGDLPGALKWYQRSVRGAEAALGPDAPELAGALNALGTQQMARGDYALAEKTLQRALGIRRRVLASDDVDIGRTLINLATLNYYSGNYAVAETTYEEALAIAMAAFGSEHPEVGTVSSGLGLAALAGGDIAKARRHLERSVAIARTSSNPGSTADALSNLALVEAHAKNWKASLTLESEALALREATVPSDHPSLAFSFSLLGELELEQKNLGKAEAHIRRAIEIRTKAGVANQLTAETTFILAKIRWLQGAKKDARGLARQSRTLLGQARPELLKLITEWQRSH